MPAMPIVSLWEPFGLRGNPFFQDELRPGAEAAHPVSLLVGREAELRRLLRRVASDTASRSIVQGDAGVGKTSFTNRLKAEASAHGIASHEHPIRITSDTTWHSFVREALRALLRARLGLGHRNEEPGFWRRTAALLEGEEVLGGGLSAAGFGGTVSRSRVQPALPIDSLYEHLGEALQRLKEESGCGVLLHVNNLENQALEHAAELSILLRDLRDFLLLDGAHWVFVGTSGIEAKIFRVHDQVGGIFPGAVELGPLSSAEVATLLEQRYAHLALPGADVVPPVEPETAAGLYEYYRGDLRNFLRLLYEAAELGLGLHGIRPMARSEIVNTMAPVYQHHLRGEIGAADYDHLSQLVGPDAAEFRVTDAAAATKLTQGAASKLVDRLLAKGAIRHTRTEGRNVYYRATGFTLVAFEPRAALLPP